MLNAWSPVCALLWTLSSLWQGAGWWEADHHGQVHSALSAPSAVNSSASGSHLSQSCFAFPAMGDRKCSDTVSQIKQYNHSSGLQGYSNTSICCCSKCQMLLTFRRYWCLNLWPCACALTTEPHPQTFPPYFWGSSLIYLVFDIMSLILWLFASPPEESL